MNILQSLKSIWERITDPHSPVAPPRALARDFDHAGRGVNSDRFASGIMVPAAGNDARRHHRQLSGAASDIEP